MKQTHARLPRRVLLHEIFRLRALNSPLNSPHHSPIDSPHNSPHHSPLNVSVVADLYFSNVYRATH